MQRQQIEHALRAAGQIVGDDQFFIIGSQSILGKFSTPHPEVLLASMEVDLIAKNKTKLTDLLNAIGEDSPFHDTFGFYVDPVDLTTAILPKGWKGRLINVKTPVTNGVTGLALDPHDLVLSKYAASRDKDLLFNQEVIRHQMVQKNKLLALLKTMDLPEGAVARIEKTMDKHFSVHPPGVKPLTLEEVYRRYNQKRAAEVDAGGISPPSSLSPK